MRFQLCHDSDDKCDTKDKEQESGAIRMEKDPQRCKIKSRLTHPDPCREQLLMCSRIFRVALVWLINYYCGDRPLASRASTQTFSLGGV
jgi:hypothetical protein